MIINVMSVHQRNRQRLAYYHRIEVKFFINIIKYTEYIGENYTRIKQK